MVTQNKTETAPACQKSGFTPGPWTSEGLNIYAPAPATIRPHIARIIYGGNCDARLIASAPELLAALELALATLQRVHPGGLFDSTAGTKDVARAAIAKAKGGK